MARRAPVPPATALAGLAAAAVLACSPTAFADGPEGWLLHCSKNCKGKDMCRQACSGEQIQSRRCAHNEACAETQPCPEGERPTDCTFSTWSAWSEPLGCAGVCTRTRSIESPNQCGGSPCRGALQDSRRCESPCDTRPVDCVVSSWSTWGSCSASTESQRERTRSIVTKPANGGKNCTGRLVETAACGDEISEPVDCAVSSWMEWSPCTKKCDGGERMRLRTIVTRASRGGAPCLTSLSEVAPCGTQPCAARPAVINCAVGEWSEWTACIGGQQTTRSRSITTPVRGGGMPCELPVVETEGCGVTPEEISGDCRLSAWSEWQLCDKTCGGGQTTRQRSMRQPAKYGGEPCEGELRETKACNVHPCHLGVYPCRVSVWSQWGECSSTCGNGGQQIRDREVLTEAQDGGLGCDLALGELRACMGAEELPGCDARDCVLGDWADWTDCSATCEGGQKTRTRGFQQQASQGGAPCEPNATEQTAECGMGPCKEALCVDGLWSPWEEWSVCTKTCHGGYRWRTRRVLREASSCGKPATGLASEYETCGNGIACEGDIDCTFTEWSDWDTCSARCNGNRKRTREIQAPPSGTGKPCGSDTEDTPLAEVEPCDSGNHCETSTEERCMFSDWEDWEECPVTCGGGQTTRKREVWTPHGNALGDAPMVGRLLSDAPVVVSTIDLPVSEPYDCFAGYQRWKTGWSANKKAWCCEHKDIACPFNCRANYARRVFWSNEKKAWCCTAKALGCSYDCHTGFAENWPHAKKEWCCKTKGLACPTTTVTTPLPGALKTPLWFTTTAPSITTAPPAVPIDIIADLSTLKSRLCNGSMKMTKPCNTDSCGEAVDCEYGAWSQWGECTQCGGQRFRQRNIVQTPMNGGAECRPEYTNQTSMCRRECGAKQYYCVWEDWGAFEACSKTCGSGFKPRRRQMTLTDQRPSDPFAISSHRKECDGTMIDVQQCDDNPPCDNTCVPQDCSLGEWSEWSLPGCEGLCKRTRSIDTPNNRCGAPCKDALIATKVCARNCESQDCELSVWSNWTACDSELDQRSKFRMILTEPTFEGKGCYTALGMTASCDATEAAAPVNCRVSAWRDWSDCDKPCGGGQQLRSRAILTEPRHGGIACYDHLAEIHPCNTQACGGDDDEAPAFAMDCQLGPWSLWSKCGDDSDQQVYRKRQVMHPASAGGMPCEGRLAETAGCDRGMAEAKNCVFSAWSAWSACPRTCGGALQSRSRSIESHAKGRGLQCEGPLLHLQPCSEDVPCPGAPSKECETSDWTTWSECSRTCGLGFHKRVRNVSQTAPTADNGCSLALEEAVPCEREPCEGTVDCKWSTWSEWSDCVPAPDVCGVGYKRRNRRIEQLPRGGHLCEPKAMDEVVPVRNCGGQPECCIDGAWDDWGDWGACVATCGRGTKKRHRRLAVKETWCGVPAAGPDTNYAGCDAAPCEQDQDCILSDWSTPQACSATCHGSRLRRRFIKQNGMGKGLACTGPTEILEMCNPAEGQAEPFSCNGHPNAPRPPQNCSMQDWSEWSPCSTTCERGYHTRSRKVLAMPQRGGEPCPKSVKEIVECHKDVPCFPDRTNCAWGDWTIWSECDAFDRRIRTRGIARMATNGGLQCEGPVSEVAPCEDSCITEAHSCFWESWTEWSACSATCGAGGAQTRVRRLKIGNATLPAAHPRTLTDFDVPALDPRIGGTGPGRVQELLAAFALGGLGLVTLYAVSRRVPGARGGASGRRRWGDSRRELSYDAVPQSP